MKLIKRCLRLPYIPIWLLAAALFGPMLVIGKALFWGTPLLQFVPWWSWAWDTLLSGHLPLWNPLVGMGAPLLANYQSALFYPPNWVYLVLFALGDTPLLAWGQALMVALHLAWAALGMALLVRRLGLGLLAQTVGGLAFGFCGYLVARAGFLSINAAAAWLPWVLLCLTPRAHHERIPLRRYLLLVVCLTLQLLAGHAQTTWYVIILAALWSGFWGWQSGSISSSAAGTPNWSRKIRALWGAWSGLLVSFLLAAAVAAVQLFPTAEYLLSSQRAEAVDFELAMSYSFWPWRLVGLFAPDFFGHPAQGDFWGYANFWEDAIYIGLLPILLALGALFGNFKRSDNESPVEPAQAVPLLPRSRRPMIWFLVAIFSVSLLLSLGKNSPLFPWLYANIPTFDLFQAPTRMMIWAEFALVMLAALGAERWRRPTGRGLYWTRLGTAGAFAVTLGAGAAWFFMGDVSPSFIRATALAGLWGMCTGGLSLVSPLRQPTDAGDGGFSLPLGVWQYGVALVIALDLFVAGRGANPAADLDIYRQSPNGPAVRAITAGGRLYLPADDEEYLKFERFLRFDSFDPGEDWLNLRAVMLPNTAIFDGIPSANNFDPLLTGRYTRWMDYLADAAPALRPHLLDLMDVAVEQRLDPGEPYGVRFERLERDGRVRWIPCALPVTDAESAWNAVVAGDVDFDVQVVLELEDGAVLADELGDCSTNAPGAGPPQVLELGPNHLEIRMDAPTAGWLLLSDSWYPGWRASVDGRRVQILPANYLFRAVPLEAGEHVVVFQYQPISFWLGLVISLVAVGVWAVALRRGRNSGERTLYEK